MRSSLPASWATTQIEPKPDETPSGPAPVRTVAVTCPVAGSNRNSFSPSNAVTQTPPYAAVARRGTPGTSTVRSGAAAPAGTRATVSSPAETTHTEPSSVAVSPTGPPATSTCGASSTSVAEGGCGCRGPTLGVRAAGRDEGEREQGEDAEHLRTVEQVSKYFDTFRPAGTPPPPGPGARSPHSGPGRRWPRRP